jgi:hypothetical protein
MIFMSTWQLGGPNWIDWFPVQECIIDRFEDEEGGVLMVDAAGGRGNDLKKLRRKFPHAPGRLIVEDLPQILEGVAPSPGIECQPIDLFEPQPVKGDINLTPAELQYQAKPRII